MTHSLARWVAVIFCAWGPAAALAAEPSPNEPDSTGNVAIEQAAARPVATFALSDVDHPVVVVDTPGGQLQLLVDTGVPRTVVDARYRGLLGPTSSASNTARVYTIHRHPLGEIAGLPLGLNEVACVDLGEMVAGEGIDGFLGMDFFKSHWLDLDWDEGCLRIADEEPAAVPPSSVAVDLTYTPEGVPQVIAVLNGISVRLSVDTGRNGPLTLSPEDERVAFPNGVGRSIAEYGMTARGILESSLTRAADMELAGQHSPDMLCSVGLPRQATTQLGSYFLREYRAVFDFRHNRLWLMRRENVVPPEVDMSGVHLLRRSGQTLVFAVDGGSSAAAAGIVAGDQIVAIDEQAAANLTTAQIRKLLRAGDGQRLSLKMVHAGAARTLELTLRKRI